MWCFKINNRNTTAVQWHYCAFVERIRCLLPHKRFAVLIICFMTAAALGAKGRVDSETAKIYFEVAQAYTETAKYDKAAEYYLRAAKDPAHKNAADYNLARVYGLQGYWGKAKSLLERQYKEAPENILILRAYAYSLAATGDETRAAELYKKLYDQDTENPEVALNYARILILAKRYDEALSFIEELKTRFTESTETRVLGELEEKIKKAQEEPEKSETETTGESGNPDQHGTVADVEKPVSDAEKRPKKSDSQTASDAVKESSASKKSPTDPKKSLLVPEKTATGAEVPEVKVKDGKKK